jgi:hypothetical protein
MIDDPVVEDVRARGRALTARFHNSPDELLGALRRVAATDPHGIVDTLRVVADHSPTEPTAQRPAP